MVQPRRERDGRIDRALQEMGASVRMIDLDEYAQEMLLLGVPICDKIRPANVGTAELNEADSEADKCRAEILRASADFLQAMRQNRQ